MAMMQSRKRALLAAFVGAAAGAMVAGCTPGHGKYTQEHKEQALQRMNSLKAATDWDMASQQFQSGDLNKALKTVEQSIGYDGTVPKSHVLRGRILIEMDRLSTALNALDRAIELAEEKPDECAEENAEANYYEGIIHERFAEYDRASECYMKAAELDGTDPQYRLAAAEMMIQMDRIDDAERTLKEGMATFEHNAGFQQTLGHIAMMRGNVSEAVRLFGEACLLAPADEGLMDDLARAQMEAKQYADAEYTLRRLIEMESDLDRRDLKFMRARCLIEIDRPVEARATLLELASDPHGARDVRVWIELGQVSLTLGEDRRLRECAQRVIAMDPSRADGHLMNAMWLHRQGKTRAAIDSLERQMRLSDDPSSLAVMVGVLYQEIGDESKARKAARLALRLDHADARAQELLDRLNREKARVADVPVTD